MSPIRSYLFIPANRPEFVEKAVASGADAVVIDLEDSVPEAERESARVAANQAIALLAGAVREVHVRVNAVGTDDFELDCDSVVVDGLSSLILPKVEDVDDVLQAATLVEKLELRRGIEPLAIRFLPLLETARGILNASSIANQDRIDRVWGGTARDGDVTESLGIRWTPEGLETLYARSKVVLDARSAGVAPITGTWVDIHDLEGLEYFLRQSRDLGFEGATAIHPSHVSAINEAFGISPEELDYYRRLTEEFSKARMRGSAAIVVDGRLVDEAMYRHAKAILDRLSSLSDGQEQPEYGL